MVIAVRPVEMRNGEFIARSSPDRRGRPILDPRRRKARWIVRGTRGWRSGPCCRGPRTSLQLWPPQRWRCTTRWRFRYREGIARASSHMSLLNPTLSH